MGHGLGVTPSLSIIKCRTTSARDWIVVTPDLTSGKVLFLNSDESELTNGGGYQSHGSSTLTFNSGTAGLLGINNSGDDYVAYCWAPVEGYSAFGSYTGNGSNDGPFVYTGFEVGWLLIKAYSKFDVWNLLDSRRDPYNVANHRLRPDDVSAETTSPAARDKDLLSNGFKIRGTSGEHNTSGATYIYAAFAESPFKYARAR